MRLSRAYDGRMLVELPLWMRHYFKYRQHARIGLQMYESRGYKHLLIIFR